MQNAAKNAGLILAVPTGQGDSASPWRQGTQRQAQGVRSVKTARIVQASANIAALF